jgi:ribosomal protein S1
VKCRTKGGMIVDVFGEAFLPGSQIDVKPIRLWCICKQNNGIQSCENQPRI